MKKWMFGLLGMAVILIACQSGGVKAGMTKEEVTATLGKADSVVIMTPVEDVYTNKLIKMETWHYGNDTMLIFSNNELVKGL